MKKKLLLVLSVLVVCAVFVLVGGAISGDPLTLKQAEENEKIYIGVFEPLTGYNAVGGNQEALGLEYARSLRPTVSVGGVEYDIEFVSADNASEVSAAKYAARELADRKVSAVLGSYGSSVAAAGGEVFAEAGIPVIGVSCTNPKVTADNELYFSVCFSDSFQGSVLARFAYGQGLRRAAVMTQAGDIYSKDLGQYFAEEFMSLGGEVEEYSFSSAQMNFEDLINSILSSKADCVFMPSSSSSGAVFIAQARQAGLDLPVIGGDTWDTETLVAELGAYGEEVYFSSPFAGEDSTNAKGAAFAVKFSAWVARSNERLEQNGGSSYAAPVTALAYDAYMMLCNAIEAADSSDPSAIAAALKSASYSGVAGDISFNELGEPGKKTAYIKTIDTEGESFFVLKTYLGNSYSIK